MSVIEKFIHTIHEYERSKYNKEVYRCIHPKCSHYQRRGLLLGKEATCFKCKNTFILTALQLRNFRPVCEFCSKSPKARELREARELALKAMNVMDIPDEIKQLLLDKTLE